MTFSVGSVEDESVPNRWTQPPCYNQAADQKGPPLDPDDKANSNDCHANVLKDTQIVSFHQNFDK